MLRAMDAIEKKLGELGLTLPAAPAPAGSYVPYRISGDTLILSGVLSMLNGAVTHAGQVGREQTVESGNAAAQVCALNVLAAIKAALGSLDRVKEFLLVNGFVNGVSGFDQSPQVINGAAAQQTPNGYGSKGYLEFESPQVVGGGSLRPQLFNMGRTIRAQIMVLRNASGVRDTTDWPDPFYVFINNFQQLYLPKSNWITAMERAYGYGANGAAVDTAGGLDTGVFVLFQYMLREGKLLNSSPRGQYLATVAGTKYVFQGVFGAGAQTLDVLQHSVVASAQALYN